MKKFSAFAFNVAATDLRGWRRRRRAWRLVAAFSGKKNSTHGPPRSCTVGGVTRAIGGGGDDRLVRSIGSPGRVLRRLRRRRRHRRHLRHRRLPHTAAIYHRRHLHTAFKPEPSTHGTTRRRSRARLLHHALSSGSYKSREIGSAQQQQQWTAVAAATAAVAGLRRRHAARGNDRAARNYAPGMTVFRTACRARVSRTPAVSRCCYY